MLNIHPASLGESRMSNITPFLWFDHQAEEAALFYTSIFKNSKITNVARYGEDTPGSPGTVMTVNFELNGQEFIALNGGPVYKFTEAVSFFVHCANQAEVDYLWDQLSAGGAPGQCGWVTDRYGVTWQIVPDALGELMGDPDPEKAYRVTQAMLKMHKLDVEKLMQAYRGE
jgi:predicted 3-demethylubiquinone-9 3-methyltransferase (glyoxalase superfamily)